jgi:hypothetical protein
MFKIKYTDKKPVKPLAKALNYEELKYMFDFRKLRSSQIKQNKKANAFKLISHTEKVKQPIIFIQD